MALLQEHELTLAAVLDIREHRPRRISLAGTIILVSVLPGALVSNWWLLLTALVGLNLLQSSVTGFCPAALVFRRCGLSSGCALR